MDMTHQYVTSLIGLYLLLSWPVGASSFSRWWGGDGFVRFIVFCVFMGPLWFISVPWGALRMPYVLLGFARNERPQAEKP